MAGHYVLIYAPDGTPFEVGQDRAAELVLNHGWTRQRVVKLEPAPKQIVAPVVQPAKADAPVERPSAVPDQKQ